MSEPTRVTYGQLRDALKFLVKASKEVLPPTHQALVTAERRLTEIAEFAKSQGYR